MHIYSQKDDQQAIAESVQFILFFSFFDQNLTHPNNKAQNSKLVLDLFVFSIFRQKNTIKEWLPKFLAQPINLHARCEFRTHTLGIKSSCALSSALNLSLDAIAIVGGGDGFTFKSFVVPSYAIEVAHLQYCAWVANFIYGGHYKILILTCCTRQQKPITTLYWLVVNAGYSSLAE